MRRFNLFCIGLMITITSFAQTSAEYYFRFTRVDGTHTDYYLNNINKVEFGKTQFIVNGSDGFDYQNGDGTAFLHLDLTRYDGVHQFNEEGFCKYADGGFQPAVLVTSSNYGELGLTSDYIGYYAIKNAGQLYWTASVVNSGKLGNGKFVLLNDIDLAVSTVTSPDDENMKFTPVWEPIGNENHYFSGTFDGRNHTITNFSYKVRQNSSGFVGAAYGAIIKNFTIYGDITAEQFDGMPVSTDGKFNYAFCGVVGQIGNGFVKNIHSYINFNVPGDITLKHIGGIVGSAGDTSYPFLKALGMGLVTINGCRYSGKMTIAGSTDCVAGILGLAGPHKMVTIQNCMFDGELDVTDAGKTWHVGGFLGYTKRHITMKDNFYCGTLTVHDKEGATGLFVGNYDKNKDYAPYEGETFEASNNYYYNTNNKLKTYGSSGDTESVAIFTNTSVFIPVTLDQIKDGTVFGKLDNGSWDKGTKEGFGDSYPVPHLVDHTHTFDADGFCTKCDWGYESATKVTESNRSELGLGAAYVGYYAIKNGGQLYWWSQYVSSYDQESKAILLNNIDMKGNAHNWPIIGSQANPFMGTFEGNGKTISNFYLNSNSATVGMFGVVHKATIKSFEINGKIISNFTFDTTKPYVGLIARIGNGETLGASDVVKTLVQDVWCKLNITSSSRSTTSYNGGIVGYVDNCGQTTTINRCIYSGTLDVKTNNDNAGGIAGLVGKGCAVTNCLFDGNITVNANKCGGIVGYSNSGCDESKGIYGRMDGILNCLSYGTVAKKGSYGMITAASNGYDAKNHKNNYFRRAGGNVRPSTDTGGWTYVPVSLSDEVLASSAVYWLGTSDWAKVSGYNYPLPKVKSSFNTPECAHSSYHNGICETCGKQYKEPAVIDAGNYESLNVSTNYIGYYLITNAGELYWFADKINNGNNKINGVLYADIDMEGDKHKWKGIGRTAQKYSNYETKDVNFEGKFEGRGHRIYNFYMEGRTTYVGLFNRINSSNALVENFTLEGDVHLYGAKGNVGSVAGTVMAGAILQDVSSSVNIHLSPEYPISVVGGVCSSTSAGVTINRCRYSGNLNANATYDKIGGICGHANGNTTISNCLFDGSITSTSTIDASDKYIRCGGIAAYASDANRTLNIKNCLSQGSISLPNNSCTNGGVGMVFGFGYQVDATKAGITINITNTYYKKDNKSSQAGAIPVVGTSTGDITVNNTSAEVSDAQMSNGTTLTALNTNPADLNWKQGEDPVLWPVPLSHKHSFINGFCQNSGCRSPYEKPAFITEGNYRIQTGGNLFWFAERVNSSGTTYANINATLMNDIDLEGWTDDTHTVDKHLWVPIGINDAAGDFACTCAFNGIFDGRGKTIKNLNFKNNKNYKYAGFFGFVSKGSVKDFTIKGELYSDYAGKIGIGLIGRTFGNTSASPVVIEDVNSELNITIGSSNSENYIGGLSGLVGTDKDGLYVTINRCTYSGTITSNAKKNVYIGGIVGLQRRCQLISNCLYDGHIIVQGTGAGTGIIGGIAGRIEFTTSLGIQNCLAVGSMTGGATRRPIVSLESTAVGNTCKNNYYLQGIADDSESWSNTTGVKPVARTAADLALESAAHQLGISNWTHLVGTWLNPRPLVGGGEERPGIPVLEEDTHQHFINGFCKLCNRYTQPAEQNAEGQYVIKNAGNLFWFASQVKQGYLTDANVIVTPKDDSGNSTTTIDLEYITDKSSALYGTARHCNTYTPIGGNTYAYAGVFNGNGTKFENFYLTATGHDAGFFGVVYGGTVKNMSVAGNIDVNAAYRHIGLVGEMGQGTVEGVASAININVAAGIACNHIGGVVGSAESTKCLATRTVGVSTINRCRYSGTIVGGNTIDNIGGIAGFQAEGAILTNNLFDGKISTTPGTTNCRVGGILGYISTATLKVANNLSVGTLSAGSGAYVGAIYGMNAANPKVYTITDNYYKQNDILPFGHAVNAECDIQGYHISDTQLATNVAAHRLGIANWTMVKTGTEARNYPLPIIEGRYSKLSACTSHTYNANGFCTNCGNYQAPTVVENVYQISNGGQLYAFAQNVNNKTYPQNAKAVLTKDIDLEGQNHPWKGIGVKYPTEYQFTGEFDGQGHTINNFYAVATRNNFGLFNYVKGDYAEICDFTINGSLDIASNAKYVSPVIGYYQSLATTAIRDITSNVNITVASGFVPSYVAGIVAQLDRGTINRCRYTGTLKANSAYDVIGGVVGNITNVCTVSNCLFDGKIISTSSNGAMSSGGIVSYKSGDSKAIIQDCLAIGTISYPNSNCSSKKIGAILGYVAADGTSVTTIKNSHYYDANMTYGSSNTKVPIYCQSNVPATVSNNFLATAEQLNNGLVVNLLGTDDWCQIEALGYPIPQMHVHDYSVNGLCKQAAHDCPLPYQVAEIVDGQYQIRNAGNLFWYAQEWNKGNISTKKAILVPENGQYIDMGYETSSSSANYGTAAHKRVFTPIGNATYLYDGVFNGNGKTIKNLYVNATGTYSGMFGRISGATIKDMTVQGAMYVGANYERLGLIGNAVNSTITRIHSKFDVNVKTGIAVSQVGGVVGYIENGTTTIDKCRYDGSMQLASSVTNLGGIAGYSNDNTVITNCLYDGNMVSKGSAANTFIAGILGKTEKATVSLQKCLSVGTIVAANDTYRGAIVGNFVKTNLFKDDYYNSNNLRGYGGINDASCDLRIFALGNSTVNSSRMAYMIDRNNWTMISGCAHPVPVMPGYSLLAEHSSHSYNANGFCTICGAYQPLDAPVDGVYQIKNGGQLYSFAETFNAKSLPQNGKYVLTKDIDLEGDAHAWYGIGVKYPTAYKFSGTFDGQGHTINNFFASSNSRFNALFLYATNEKINNTDRYPTIRNFNINGDMQLCANVDYNAPVVGDFNGVNSVIEDVTCSVNLNVLLGAVPNYIAGVVGYMGNGKVNRCRYNGQMTLREAYNIIGGICGNIGGGTITNCLYDGEMTGTRYSDALTAGGIIGYKGGDTDVTISNCFVKGSMKFPNASCGQNKLGIVLGYTSFNGKTLALNSIYYTSDNKLNKKGVLTSVYGSKDASKTGVVVAGACEATDQMMSNGTLLRSLGSGEWWQKHTASGVAQEAYPIPYKGGVCSYSSSEGYCSFCGYDKSGCIHISTPAELVAFRNLVNNLDATYTYNAVVENDLDMGTINGGQFGDPIGYHSQHPYIGTFDGKGHKIENICVKALWQQQQHQGLFAYVGINKINNVEVQDRPVTIKNFSVSGNVIINTNSNDRRMGVIGSVDIPNTTNCPVTIENIHSYLNFSAPNQTDGIKIGGIVGGASTSAKSPITINGCSYVGNIHCTKSNGCADGKTNHLGGIVGYTGNYVTVSNCLAMPDISLAYNNKSTNYLGGIVGFCNGGSFGGIKNCLSLGATISAPNLPSGSTLKIGAIVGYDSQSSKTYNANNYIGRSSLIASNGVEGKETSAKATSVSESQLNSGEVCALLNTGINAGNAVWGQVLGNVSEADAYPTPCRKNFVTKDASNNYKADKYILSAGGGQLHLPDFTSSSNKCVEAKDLTISAKFIGDGWLPIYVPLRLTYDSWKNDFDVTKIMNFHHYIKKADASHPAAREFVVLEIQKVTQGTLKDNHPYLIKAKDNSGANVLSMHLTDSNTPGAYRSVYEMNGENTVTCSSTENKYVFKGNYSDSFAFPEKTGELADANFYVLYPEDEIKAMMEAEAAKTKYSKSTSELVPMCSWYMTQTRRSDVELGGTVLYAPQRIFVRYSGFDIDELMNDFGEFGEPVDLDDIVSDDVHPVLYITSDGVAHDAPQSGKMNIIKMSDGSFMKVMMK